MGVPQNGTPPIMTTFMGKILINPLPNNEHVRSWEPMSQCKLFLVFMLLYYIITRRTCLILKSSESHDCPHAKKHKDTSLRMERSHGGPRWLPMKSWIFSFCCIPLSVCTKLWWLDSSEFTRNTRLPWFYFFDLQSRPSRLQAKDQLLDFH